MRLLVFWLGLLLWSGGRKLPDMDVLFLLELALGWFSSGSTRLLLSGNKPKIDFISRSVSGAFGCCQLNGRNDWADWVDVCIPNPFMRRDAKKELVVPLLVCKGRCGFWLPSSHATQSWLIIMSAKLDSWSSSAWGLPSLTTLVNPCSWSSILPTLMMERTPMWLLRS